MPADVPVESRRTGAQQVVVDRRDLDPVLDQLRHDGTDLGLQQYEVAHHHDFAVHGFERDPAAEGQRRLMMTPSSVTVRSLRGKP